MGSLSRREKDRLFALFIRSLIVIIVLAMMGGLILFFKDKSQSVETTSATGDNMISDTETESPQSYIKRTEAGFGRPLRTREYQAEDRSE